MICGTCKTLFVLKLVGDDERHRQYSIDARAIANVRGIYGISHFFFVDWSPDRRAGLDISPISVIGSLEVSFEVGANDDVVQASGTPTAWPIAAQGNALG